MDEYLAEQMKNPKFRAAWAEVNRKPDSEYYEVCNFGQCTAFFEVFNGKAKRGGEMGTIGCPCDVFKEWSTTSNDQRTKPRVLAKTKGRHGSRIQRSIKRHSYYKKSEYGYRQNWMMEILLEREGKDNALFL